MTHTPRVLVAYATTAGSTADVAEHIAEVLRTAGCEVLCRPADADVDPAGYDALVLGSAVHNIAWMPAAAELLQRAASGGTKVWCFSVGGLNPYGRCTRYIVDRETERIGRRFPADFTPRNHRVFGGVVRAEATPLWGRLLYRLCGVRAGDHRDWSRIGGWAMSIALELMRTRFPDRPPAPVERTPAPVDREWELTVVG